MLRPLLLLLSITIAPCVRAQIFVPADSIPAMAEETYRLIRAHHPFCYEEAGRRAVDRARTQVQNDIDEAVLSDSVPLTRVVQLLLPLQRATGCGHLILRPRLDSLARQRVYGNRFGLQMALIGEDTYVVRNGGRTGEDSIPPGTEVLRINGEPVAEVIRGISAFQGLNDHGADRAPRATYARFPSSQYQKFYGPQDSLLVTIEREDGPFTFALYPTPVDYSDAAKDSVNLEDLLRYEALEDGRVGHLTIRSFTSKAYREGNYFQFIRETFDKLRQQGAEKLIIDIRGNTGGNSSKIIYLFRRLAERPFYFAKEAYPNPADSRPTRRERRIRRQLTYRHKPVKKETQQFRGEVIVLVDELSYSASGMFARMVQGTGRGKLIGSPTGAAAGVVYSGSGKYQPFPIGPADVMELLVNDIRLVQDFAVPGTTQPDIVVSFTVDDLRNGRDPQLARALAE